MKLCMLCIKSENYAYKVDLLHSQDILPSNLASFWLTLGDCILKITVSSCWHLSFERVKAETKKLCIFVSLAILISRSSSVRKVQGDSQFNGLDHTSLPFGRVTMSKNMF